MGTVIAMQNDFDDVIKIVNERHEHCRFHDYVRQENKKEKERLHKERMHELNRKMLHWFANASYFVTGGVFTMSLAYAALDQMMLSILMCGIGAAGAILALYFEKRERQFD